MSDAQDFIKFREVQNAAADVIFVHGLTGQSEETWVSASGDECWVDWLCEAFPTLNAYAIGYPSGFFENWAKADMNLHERANNLLEMLAARGIGERPIIFIAHSMGGIVVKQILRTAKESVDPDWQRVAENTRLVVFLSTPHAGAMIASVVKQIAPRTSSSFIDLLTNESGYLTNLNEAYRNLVNDVGIETVTYFEKYKTKGVLLVVSAESADPGVGGSIRPVCIDADHISICRPKDRDSLVFISICRHIKRALNGSVTGMLANDEAGFFAADDYTYGSEFDRRDLLQKLIDAGREHEYRKANDLQNKFAQRYYKLGLYTDAKVKADAVLASVEQRFLTHVYPKICSEASDIEISNALQVHVIDAVCAASDISEVRSPTAVLQALYFLTEQCHIQWDAA